MLNIFFKNPNPQVPKYPSTQSFTLIEMVVVLGITAFIATLLIANMHSGGESMDLTSEAQKLGGVIRQAQNMALTGQQINSSRPVYGYGVYVDSTSYKLFMNDDDGASYLYSEGNDTIIQSFSFPDNIKMTIPASAFSIIFTPPLGEVYASAVLPLNISLTYVPTNLNRFLRITSYGEVDIFK